MRLYLRVAEIVASLDIPDNERQWSLAPFVILDADNGSLGHTLALRNDLREAINGVLETVVEPVDEYQDAAVGTLPYRRVEPGVGFVPGKVVRVEGGEIGHRVGRKPLRPGDFTDLADGRDRYRHVRKRRRSRSFSREHLSRMLGAAPCRRYEHGHPAGRWRGVCDGRQHVFGMPTTSRCHSERRKKSEPSSRQG